MFQDFSEMYFRFSQLFDRRKQAVYFADLIEKYFKTENAEKISLN